MISEIQNLLDRYVAWLRDKTALREVGDLVEITTPYLDRHNDYLQIYVKRNHNGYILTDDGYVIEDLEMSGCSLESRKRQDLLQMTLNGFGVRKEHNALVVHASSSNFAMQKHNLVQAMLAVNDLFYLAAPIVAGIFLEDVTSWLDLCEIPYTPKVKFSGKSGYDHLFDFVIPGSKKRNQPERIVQAINRPNKETATAIAFAWIDTREVRPDNSKAYAFLNDAEGTPSSSVMDALYSYNVNPVLWSERELTRPELLS